MPSIFADNLYKHRKRNGLTQEELGKKIGVSRKTIESYELDLSYPREKNLYSLANALGVPVSQLVDENDIKKKDSFKDLRKDACTGCPYSKACKTLK